MYKYLVTYCWYRHGSPDLGMQYADCVVDGDPMAWLITTKEACKAQGEHVFLLNVEQLNSSEHVRELRDGLTTDN